MVKSENVHEKEPENPVAIKDLSVLLVTKSTCLIKMIKKFVLMLVYFCWSRCLTAGLLLMWSSLQLWYYSFYLSKVLECFFYTAKRGAVIA